MVLAVPPGGPAEPRRRNIAVVSARRLLARWFDLGGDGDACCGGVAVEVVEGGELVRAGLDRVAGLVQEAADAAGVAAGELVADAGQGGGGVAGQAVAVAEDDGEELGGEGDAGAAAGAG